MTRFHSRGAQWALALLIPIAANSASVTVGGSIPLRIDVQCSVEPGLNFDQTERDARIATCRVSSTSPDFDVRLVTELLGHPDQSRADFIPDALEIRPIGGLMGQGLAIPPSQDLLKGWRNGEWVWEAGPQETSSIDFLFELRGSWKGLGREPQRVKQNPTPWQQVLTAAL
jgi:hypothetical protein